MEGEGGAARSEGRVRPCVCITPLCHLRQRLKRRRAARAVLIQCYPTFGYRRLWAPRRRDGVRVNRKTVYHPLQHRASADCGGTCPSCQSSGEQRTRKPSRPPLPTVVPGTRDCDARSGPAPQTAAYGRSRTLVGGAKW